MKVVFNNVNKIFDKECKVEYSELASQRNVDHIKLFEEECATYLNVPFCYAAKSGLAALFLALRMYNIGKGDKVAIATTSHDIIASAVTSTKAEPVFCDVDMDYWTIDPSYVSSKLTDIDLILADHAYGNPCDIEGLTLLWREKQSVPIIEAGINAFGAKLLNMPIGSLTDTSVIGFFGKGVISTNSVNLRHFLHEAGGSRRIDIDSAIFGRLFLRYIDKFIENRNEKAGRYLANLNDLKEIKFQRVHSEGLHSYERFVIFVDQRDDLFNYLTSNEIEVQIHYDMPLHKMKVFEEFNYLTIPISEQLCRGVLSLPIYANMPDDEIDFVCEKIRTFYTKGAK